MQLVYFTAPAQWGVEFEPTNYDITVQNISHNVTGILLHFCNNLSALFKMLLYPSKNSQILGIFCFFLEYLLINSYYCK